MALLSRMIMIMLILVSSSYAGAGTGVDPILESVGIEKPAEWDSWSHEQKHDYLQGMGVYPVSGEKYQGQANISGFFDWLGVEMPDEWENLSFEEKNAFVTNTLEENEKSEDQTVEENDAETFKFAEWIVILSSVFVLIAGFLPAQNTIRRFGRLFSLYILPVLLILLAILFPWTPTFVEMGRWAEWLLIFLLFVKPMSVIFSIKQLSKVIMFRQELGLSCFWLFLIHALGRIVITPLGLEKLIGVPYLLWGVIAGIVLIILAITSNKKSIMILRSNWKKVQSMAYFALFATLLHTSIVSGEMIKLYVVFGLFIVLKIMEWKKIVLR